MQTLWQDVRYGARMLMKNPAVTLIAVVALALGIGANTAIFLVVNAVLLKPLPFAAPDQLIGINAVNLKNGDAEFGGASPADFLDWAAQSKSFDGVAAYRNGAINLSLADFPEQFVGASVSDDFFKALKVSPLFGRTFLPEEFRIKGNRAVLLSYRLWQRRFGGDQRVVGKTLTIDGRSATIVGVMSQDFKEPAYAEAWTPLLGDTSELKARGSRYFNVIARLKPNVTLQQAQAEMTLIAQRLEQQYPQTNANWGARVVPLQEQYVKSVRPVLLILLGAVSLVLLIACANVANLLLARATSRHKEIAIRAALGATRWRVVRQLLIESLLLSFVGGACGLLLALWGVDVINALMPETLRLQRLDQSSIDLSVLCFTFTVSLLTGLFFGLVPALKVSKPDLHNALKEGGRSATSGLRLQRTRAFLVASEIALTLLLLVGAGLLIKSLLHLREVNLGFAPQNLLTLQVTPPLTPKYLQEAERARLYSQIRERIETLPGVQSVAATSEAPLARFGLSFPFVVVGGATNLTADAPKTIYTSISPEYFRTLKIPLRAGREFTERDNANAPGVAIINETMARRAFRDADPIGKRLKITYLDAPIELEIVGVAGDVKQSALSDEIGVEMYVPYLQHPWLSTAFVVRANVDPSSLALSVQRAVAAIDKNQPVSEIKTMEQLLSQSIAQPRFYTSLLGAFAAVALVLASIGIYGVMSYTVTQRTHEIGIRLALGAQSSDVLKMIVRQGMTLALFGIALGIIGALALTRVMANLLYDVSATDPMTFACISLFLITVTLLACYIPARRATKVDPMIALRYE